MRLGDEPVGGSPGSANIRWANSSTSAARTGRDPVRLGMDHRGPGDRMDALVASPSSRGGRVSGQRWAKVWRLSAEGSHPLPNPTLHETVQLRPTSGPLDRYSGRLSPVNDLARFFVLERRLLERLSTRIEPFEHGTAFLDEEFRDRYNSNFLLVEQPLEGVPAKAILQEADRILGGASYPHREVVVRDDRHGERLAPAFANHRYTVARNVIMVHRRAPDRDPDLVTEELSFAQVRPLLHEINRRQPWATSDETVRVLTDQHGKFERVIGARFFAVRCEGTLAGNCELYMDDLDAQVENVDTLEEFRGRGVARGVVLRAVRAARDAGAEHVFIVADEADWVRELYGRLGFDRVGRTWQFTRWPKGVPEPRTASVLKNSPSNGP